MKKKTVLISLFMICIVLLNTSSLYALADDKAKFNFKKDLLLVNFDCKTDVDDLHTAAGLATILASPKFLKINYHIVAGTYGIQKGLYVPPNSLLELAFENNWTDAHEQMDVAIEKVKIVVKKTLEKGGDVWIAEAGQSDFSAKLIQVIQKEMPKIAIAKRFHIVQHSEWNENKTAPEYLEFVKKNTDYYKIPDGNEVGNGTPGFKSLEYKDWNNKIKNPKLVSVWQLAIELASQYNGKGGRYTNKSVSAGSLDFSDLTEVTWILGLNDIGDVEDFFNQFAN